jgi:hypothetical protein
MYKVLVILLNMTNKDIFLSHAWGTDDNNRNNHSRVKNLSKLLQEKGYSVWLDENDLLGNIDNSIMKGITNSQVVLVCLTEKYCNKINNSVYDNSPNDNCYKEWNFCLFKQKKIIPIIMEKKMEDIFLNTDGVIQMYLNNVMFINYYDDENNDFDILCKTLRLYNVYTRDEKIFMNIKPNSSFDRLKDLLQLSPKRLKIPSPLTITIPDTKKNNLLKSMLNKMLIKTITSKTIKILLLRKQKSKRFNILGNKSNIKNETIVNI